MVVYIHGFGSSGFSKKARILKAHFGSENFFAPSLSYIPELAIDTLDQMLGILTKSEDITLVGSSLGGYYATYFADKYNLKAVLVNPSVFPYKTLAAHVGINHSYHDSSDYGFIQAHIDSLKAYEIVKINPENFMVLLQTEDEVLDYRHAQKKYAGAKMVIEEGGDHSFINFASKVEMVEEFASLS